MASEQIPSPLVDLLRQYKLLQEEFEFEKETFYQQTQRAGIPKEEFYKLKYCSTVVYMVPRA